MADEKDIQSSEMLSTIFKLNPDAIALTRVSDGKFIDCNHEFLNQIGYSRNEVIGHTSLELNLYSFKKRQEYLDEISKEKFLYNFEVKLRRKDGDFIYILYSARFITLGGEQIILNIGHDITERKKSEDKQEKLSKQLQLALDAAKMGWWHYNPITDISSYDKRYKEIFGVLGSERPNDEILKLLHPDDLPEVWKKVEEALDPVNPIKYHAEYRIYRNNEIRWIEAHGITTFEGHGNSKHAVSLVGTVNDITERKRSDKYQQELLEKEQLLTEELQTTNEELQAVNEELMSSNEELMHQREELIHLNQAIFESEKRMNRSQEIAHLGSWELDINNNHLSWSDEVYRIFGLQPQEFDATYESFLENIHPDDRQAVDEAYSASIRDGKDTYEIEHRIVRKYTGEIRFVYEKCEHFRDSKGDIVRSVGMVHDITNRIKTEEKTKRILESIGESYVEYDNEWRYVDVNTKTEKLIGIDKDKLVNKVVWELFPQLIGTKQYKELHRAKKENIPVKFETQSLLSKNWYEINAYPHPEGLSVYSNNINERKQNEKNLKESEEKYRTLHETMRDAFVSVKMDGQLHDCNDIYLNMLGYTEDEIYNLSYVDLTPEKWHAMESEIVDAQILTRGFSDVYEKEYLRKDGTVIPVELKTFLIRDHEGDPLYMWAIVRDITERKHQNKREQKFIEELKRSNEELERFAYVSSHDLQEPLRMVTLYSQLLERRYKDSLDSDAYDFIEYIVENAKRMKQLIDDLLEYSRVTSQAKEFENIDVEKVLENVLSNLAIPIVENNVNCNT